MTAWMVSESGGASEAGVELEAGDSLNLKQPAQTEAELVMLMLCSMTAWMVSESGGESEAGVESEPAMLQRFLRAGPQYNDILGHPCNVIISRGSQTLS